MKRREPPATLALERRELELALLAADHRIEEVLDSVFPDGWQDYELGTDVIDVYGVIPSPVAFEVLHRAGFVIVWLHEHPAKHFTDCACRTRSNP